jgi:hypothetical protein
VGPTEYPQSQLWLAGFSFGAYVTYRNAADLQPGLLLSIAPPVGRSWEFEDITHPNCPWLVIQGEDDEIVDAQAVKAWAESLKPPPELVLMPETSHFFHRKLMDLRGAIKSGVRPWLPRRGMSEAPVPSAAYAAGVAPRRMVKRPAQHAALRELDRLHAALSAPAESDGFLSRLFRGKDAAEAPRGLYLWGGVGRGKTFLIDLFFDGLPIDRSAARTSIASCATCTTPARARRPARPLAPSPANGATRCACWCSTSSSSATSATRCCSVACSSGCSPKAWCW